jgi:hypothetical protein
MNHSEVKVTNSSALRSPDSKHATTLLFSNVASPMKKSFFSGISLSFCKLDFLREIYQRVTSSHCPTFSWSFSGNALLTAIATSSSVEDQYLQLKSSFICTLITLL